MTSKNVKVKDIDRWEANGLIDQKTASSLREDFIASLREDFIAHSSDTYFFHIL